MTLFVERKIKKNVAKEKCAKFLKNKNKEKRVENLRKMMVQKLKTTTYIHKQQQKKQQLPKQFQNVNTAQL